ncbi:nonribosomal peptide synthetase 10 [Aaosphaeria arxii CBS 175.79]|uniref:Nonribosomal peptide synthetase 10 n=1 Tax=Aaosphaeria arxii CBS 175.79 TaxID=1450172 RepID=A0A6A5XV48_9PLEO|nr:nonribosomal peptide synthetase 10 [Aaosphaeria arxii CBS 175.79]KAF2016687.1 nonribosomal peptide synthetase 10 [Aaosphaeria arxii CBS 175.79]
MSVIDITKDLSALFSRQVKQSPDALALEDESTSYTYAELDAKVEALSKRLRGYGVVRDSLIGVLLPRSSDYVIACLASLRAGGAFLVLELAYPPDLLADVIDDADPAVIVTYRNEVGKIKPGIPLVTLDEEPVEKVQENGNGHLTQPLPPLPSDEDLDRLCFVAYSSGTTGKPKGIANPHRASVLSYDLRFQLSDIGPGDRVACNVFFVWEIIRPLLRGATVVAVPDDASYDPVLLVDLLSRKKITETLMTPTLLAAVLSRHQALETRLPQLKSLWLNGEVVTTDLARRTLKALPHTRLLNCYSACETHEIACGDIKDMLTKLDSDALYCPVGPPLIDRKYIYILDESGQRVEDGTSGELFVGGKLLARGYLNRPETTARAFTSNPFDSKPGSRMYRTGDKARLLPSGLLEITGRTGAMIKLRGYSVVPGKVENAIVKYLAVHRAAVVANGEGLERQLVAYFVRDREASEDRPKLEINDTGHSPQARRTLSQSLAPYMIPSLWVELDELPTHGVSGKVDLARLPPPTPRAKSPVNGQRAEHDPIQIEAIKEIWAASLNVGADAVTPEHNFFDLGGHSLSLADLASRLSNQFGFRVPVSRLADPATLNGHLETLRSVRDGVTASIQADLPAVLRADSVLDKDIQISDVKPCSLKDADTVLLTGVTGFLGAFLLNDLLENTSAKVICLVRFNDPSQDDLPGGIARIRRNLLDFGLWNDSIMERVEILPGNLSRKRFGLSPEAFKDVASRVQVIIHAAATVNLVYPYAALRRANIGGTREIIRLAALGSASLLYVSTNGVLPPALTQAGWPENAMLTADEVPEKIPDGYGQTKWVAEQLAVEASKRGLPVRILRCGTISGHSASGAANAWDLLTAFIVESAQIGYWPDVPGWRAEMTPVDFVSKAIVHLGNQTHADQLVFHLGDPTPVQMSEVFDILQTLGYPSQPLGFDEWVSLWTEKRGSAKGGDGAFTVDVLRTGMPSVEFLRDIVVLDNAATRPFRAQVQRPKVDEVLLETYARHWFARGWLPRPPKQNFAKGGSAQLPRRGPLFGRVAVVTGASSGIGAAVTTALARAGCHIAIGARRVDELEKVKKSLVVREGKVIIRKTDVTDRKQVEELINAAETELGPVDILVSCAGVMYFTMMANNQVDEWERTVDVNCKGLLNCLSSTVPGMLKRGKGHIVAISSDAGRKVFPGLGVYSASKFFVEATLQSLRLETAGTGLRVTSVQPGNVATDLLGMSTDQEALKKYGEPSGAKVLDADDIARSIIYALKQPDHVSVNEVLIEPRDEPI